MTHSQIFKKTTLKAPVKEVWNKWTTNEGIKTFFSEECHIELVINGAYEMYFLKDNPTGLQGSEGCKVLSFLPNQMLSFSWNAPPHFEQVRGSYTWVVVLFNSLEDRLTELELYHLGWQSGGQWNEVYQYFMEAWDVVLNRLKNSLTN